MRTAPIFDHLSFGDGAARVRGGENRCPVIDGDEKRIAIIDNNRQIE